MKLVKSIILSFFFLVLGNQMSVAQQTDTNKPEQYLPNAVNVKSSARMDGKTKRKSTPVVNTSETSKLYSIKEKESRALTAKKSKELGKGNITPQEAKRQREARVAAIIEANKTKKKTTSKGNNKTKTN
ncbi:hypothetical protein [Aquimarina sp. SS2-1]|uniref:hypothetical protein n=1 Tax=Aquimarina besae TaxID=3342247 RepID=UPI003670BC8A